MKKYFKVLLLGVFAFGAVSCDDRNDDVINQQDNDTYAVMADVTGNLNAGNNYTLTKGITIKSSDVVLVYRNVSTTGSAVWQIIPKTEFLSSGRELDYNFLFDTANVEIFTEANFDQATLSPTESTTYLNNQRFRIVLVPASPGKNAQVNYNDYYSVIKYFNIPDRK